MPKAERRDREESCEVSLHIGNSFQAAWENVLLPWFESIAPRAFENQAPVAVVAPIGSHSAFLRQKLLEHRVSLLGIKFLSPRLLREILLRGSSAKLPLREHLRLLLATAAEEFSARTRAGESEQDDFDLATIAKSVARDPDHFLRAIDQLNAAGWSFADAGSPALQKIVDSFQKLAGQCGFQMLHEADRTAVEAAATSPPRFSDLLVTGFNAAHWPVWPLLRAAVLSARKATVVLSDPRDEARDLDETWVGTWEETFGASQPISEAVAALDQRRTNECDGHRRPLQQDAEPSGETPAGRKTFLHELTRLPESPSELKARAAHPIEDVHFLVGRNATEQARAIVALTAQFLSEKSCERIGILFPSPGALHRLVTALLEETKIPHNDAIGHPATNPLDGPDWRAWLDLQENPRLKSLFRFLRTFENGEKIFADVSVANFEKTLRSAYDDVLIDDIEVLREYCAHRNGEEHCARVASGLTKLRFLPEHGAMSILLGESRKIFEQFGWRERWSEIDRLSRNWSEAVSALVSRRTYLRWLAEIGCTPAIERDECGDHPYSRVQLLRYAAAEGQDWPHLILTGLNEGEWPPRGDDSGFIREQEIVDLNRGIRRLNRSAIRQGRHGEGQWSVEEGKTLYLGPAEQAEIARRQFFNLLESAGEKIGVTANLFQDSAPERTWNPSDFFSRLYFAARGKPVSQEVMDALEASTRAWLKKMDAVAGIVDPGSAVNANIAQSRAAYDARRQPEESGEHEFALLKPPERAVSFRVTDWEKALKNPALVWMKYFLGVEADDETGDGWSRSTGKWVHDWLAQSAGATNENGFVQLPPLEAIRSRLLDAAREFLSQVERLCERCSRALPDWWSSGWNNALYVADCLAAHLSELHDWSHLATEWQLASPEIIPLDDNKDLRIRGRIDLILARGRANASLFGFADLWVIDFKTGRQRGFNLRELRRNESSKEKLHKQLVDGRGVQLGLYALAARQLGGSSIQLTLLTPSGDLEPQFHIGDVLEQEGFWCELHRMQETGVFGMLGEVRPEFGFAPPYPLATLGVDLDLLREKWRATHPAFATLQYGGGES